MANEFRIGLHRLKTPSILYTLHRQLFCATNGRWNDLLTKFIQNTHSQLRFENNGIIDVQPEKLAHIIDGICQDGFYVFDETLPASLINNLTEHARKTPLRFATHENGQATYSTEKIAYQNALDVDSPRFQMDAKDILSSDTFASLIFDPTFAAIAQAYFGSRPILDLISLWWSRPRAKTTLEDFAAQRFHFDMDRIRFLKFFFYLTDVDEKNGPHTYIRGSHKRLPSAFHKDARFEDETIRNHFASDDIISFTKPKGSIFAVDTRGLHKGEPLISGERLIFQIEFANSMFGQFYPKVSWNQMSEQVQNKVLNCPLVYAPMFDRSPKS